MQRAVFGWYLDRLHGRDIPIAEDLLGIVRPGHHPEGEWARDLLEEKGLREGVYMSR